MVDNFDFLASAIDWSSLWIALGLLALALTLLILELFLVSFGVLLIAAIASAGAAIHYAFAAGDAAGWAMAVVTPIIAAGFFRWGFARIRISPRLVAQSEITAEAGYHHHAEENGVHPDAIGVMMTSARPSGRARFDDGECDVQVRSGSLERGAKVVVRRIDGPIVFVTPVIDHEPNPTER